MEKTILEDKTILDTNTSTTIENKQINSSEKISVNSVFKDYKIVKQLPTIGAEADVYIIEKNQKNYILKLYRHGIELEKEKIEKILNLSKKYPEDIVQIFEIKKDKTSNRWYEIQEYAKYGTLQNIITNHNKFAREHIKEIIKEMTLLLQSIHKENVIHRDIKPQNILVRTMEPLDLILTDFGISSIIDEEISKIMTSKSGTRIYFAPESFSGVIGYEVDFWALGMIILEIYEGSNIFKGLNEGMIAHEIFTKGVEVPEYLDNDIKLLLKGLLTRDPKKRWNEKQIFQWLKREKNISIFYDYNINNNTIPYKFKDKKFYNIKDLLTYMYNLEHYEMAKSHIMRGYITKWLEKQELYDEAIILEDLKNNNKDIDIAIFSIFNYFVNPKDFIWKGQIITLENLLKYLQKNDSLWNNDINLIIKAYDIFIQNHKKNDKLYFVLNNIKYISINDRIYFLKIVIENKLAYSYLIHNQQLIKNKKINFKKVLEFFNENLYDDKELFKELTNLSLNFEDLDDVFLYKKLSEEMKTLKNESSKKTNNTIKIEKFISDKKAELIKEWDNIKTKINNKKIILHNQLDCFSKKFNYLKELEIDYEKKLIEKMYLSILTIGLLIFFHFFKHLNLDIFIKLAVTLIILLIIIIALIKKLKYNYSLFIEPSKKWRSLCKNS